MEMPRRFVAEIKLGGNVYRVKDNYECEYFSARLIHKKNRVSLEIAPADEMIFEDIRLTAELTAGFDDRVFMNGYQSRTESCELRAGDKMHCPKKKAFPMLEKLSLDRTGDYGFVDYLHTHGDLHGFSYCYIRKDGEYLLIGSLSERNGFTVISLSAGTEMLTMRLDCEGAVYRDRFTALDIAILTGGEDEVFDRYFEMMKCRKPDVLPLTCRTTSYSFGNDIGEYCILREIEDIRRSSIAAPDLYRIGAGWQTEAGCTAVPDLRKFPEGMRPISDAIHEAGMLSGIRFTPFVCSADTEVYKDHPNWLLRDKNGDPVPADADTYALDFCCPEFKEHIRSQIDTILNDWGFDMIEFDLLYAVCELPHEGRSRGQLMCEAMDFLRECMGDKLLLAAGVPLMPAFGTADYCRVSCDIRKEWDFRRDKKRNSREQPSVRNAMLGNIFRRQLNGRAFLNDPGDFLLSEESNSLLHCQRQSLAFIDHLCGSLYSTSDNENDCTPRARKILSTARRLTAAKLISAEVIGSAVELTIELNGARRTVRLCGNGKLTD